MNKIAVLFPSRFRPEGLRKAFASWKLNSSASEIFFCFQKGDPALAENIQIIEGNPYILAEDIGLAAKCNLLCQTYRGYDAYMVLNDDQIIHTKDWDRSLLAKVDFLESEFGHRLWILYWRDGIQDGRLPQGFATKELLNLMNGNIFPSGYMRHSYIDNTYKFIGESCKILSYEPNIFIEHRHFSNGKAVLDASYQQSISHVSSDQQAYDRWVMEVGRELVKRISQVQIEAQLEISSRLSKTVTKALDLGCDDRPKNLYNATNTIGISYTNAKKPNVSYVNLAIDSIPYPDNSFDFVTAYHFLHLIPKVIYYPKIRNSFIELMNEIYRVLKPNGLFLSITPAYPHTSAFNDPVQQSIITEETFPKWFDDTNLLARRSGFHGKFSVSPQEWVDGDLISQLKKEQ